jgi:hypothetical protein
MGKSRAYMGRQILCVAALLASTLPALAVPTPGHSPDCLCRAPNSVVRVGETACISGRVAYCVMVLNNTSWKLTDETCPISWRLPPRTAQ